MPQYAQGPNVTEQEWSKELCDCSPCDACLLATCLPCILHGRTTSRMQDPISPPKSCNADCALFCCVQYFGLAWILVMMKRGDIRDRYGLRGSGCSDCLKTFFCTCCAMIQQDSEVAARNGAGPIIQGYQPQNDMVMPSSKPEHPGPGGF